MQFPPSHIPEPPTSIASFSEAMLEPLAELGAPRELGDGEILFRQGEPGDSMFIVLEGGISLRFDEGIPVKRLGRGAFFGELALLAKSRGRTATAVALGRTRLCVLTRAELDELARERPALFYFILWMSCSYLLDSEQWLVEALRAKNSELERALDYLRRTREDLDRNELLAMTDELTGLYNRRCFNHQADKFARLAGATGEPLSLIVLDLDGFKPVNDRFGHAQGDAVLRLVARAIRTNIRHTDLACRLGGDEFALLLKNSAPAPAQARAEQLRAAVQAMPLGLADISCRVTTSMGGTLYRPDEPVAAWVERADRNLYAAKRAGRNRLVWLDAD